MKTKRASYLSAALIVPLLLLVGCDAVGGGPGDSVQPDFKIHCFMPENGSTPVFMAEGAISDEGVVEGAPLPVGSDMPIWRGGRVFQGENGTILVYVEAELKPNGRSVAEGLFRINGGTGAYEALEGDGEFRAVFDGQNPVEYFEGWLQ